MTLPPMARQPLGAAGGGSVEPRPLPFYRRIEGVDRDEAALEGGAAAIPGYH